MAVDIKTLRIGSHVEYDGKRVRICSLKTNMANYDDGKGKPRCFGSNLAYYKRMQPIPITPGLLKELGFNKGMSSAIGFDSWYCDMMRIDNNVMQAHPWWFYNHVKLRYLHELESLYYMRHGVELIKE